MMPAALECKSLRLFLSLSLTFLVEGRQHSPHNMGLTFSANALIIIFEIAVV